MQAYTYMMQVRMWWLECATTTIKNSQKKKLRKCLNHKKHDICWSVAPQVIIK